MGSYSNERFAELAVTRGHNVPILAPASSRLRYRNTLITHCGAHMRSIAFTKPLLLSTMVAILGACAVGSAHDDARVDAVDAGAFTMQPGQEVRLTDHGRLRYLRVLADSRCQPDVQCIWAGDAEVAFQWTPAGGTARPFSLHTGKEPRQQDVGGRRLSLVSLGRGAAPQAQLRIDDAPSP